MDHRNHAKIAEAILKSQQPKKKKGDKGGGKGGDAE
jgi:hypothetical protein